jgi:hypothetical protein
MVLHALSEKLAGKRQLHSARRSVEKRMADKLLPAFDLLAERRLSHAQPLRSPVEMERLRHS